MNVIIKIAYHSHIQLIIILFSISASLLAQDKTTAAAEQIKVLEDQLSKNRNDAREVSVLNQLSPLYPPEDYNKALNAAQRALSISLKENLILGATQASYNLGNLYLSQNNEILAFEHFYSAMSYGRRLSNKNVLGPVSKALALIHLRENEIDKALYYLGRAAVYSRGENWQLYAEVLLLSGELYLEMDSINDAAEYFERAVETGSRAETSTIALAREKLGLVYLKQEKNMLASRLFGANINYYQNINDSAALVRNYTYRGTSYQKQREYSKALQSLQDGLSVVSLETDPLVVSECYEVLGWIYWHVDSSMLALDYLLTAVKLRESYLLSHANDLEVLYKTADLYISLGQQMDSLGFYLRATEYLHEGFDKARETYSPTLIRRASLGLSSAYYNLEQEQDAEMYLIFYDAMQDTLPPMQFVEEITRLEMQASFNKEKEIRRLRQEKLDAEREASQRRINQIRMFFLVVFVAVLIFAFLANRGLRRIQKDHKKLTLQQREILKKNRELNGQKEEILKQAEQIEQKNWQLERINHQLKTKNEQIKTSQQQLILQEKLATVGQLITGITHEIQNPLNFVNNFSRLTGELTTELSGAVSDIKQEINEEAYTNLDDITRLIHENVEKINTHGKRADRIIKGMLQQSRDAGEFERTDLNTLVSEYTSLAYHGEKTKNKDFALSIVKNLDKKIGNVNVVPHDIGRVILNLVTNSCYAIREKQRKRIPDYDPVITLKTEDKGKNLVIKVHDNGTGLSPTIRNRIFNPFFTTKPSGEGTGLGLSTSYEIISKVHKGNIEVKSKKDEFTEFIITIPKNLN